MNYDDFRRLISVIEDPADGLHLETRYEYDTNGNLRHIYDPKNNHIEYVYDALNRKTQHIQHKSGGNLTVKYEYDGNGNLTTMTDAKGEEFSYTYYELDRQEKIMYPDVDVPYIEIVSVTTTYDENNNIKTVTENKSGIVDIVDDDVTTNTYDDFDRLDYTTQRGLFVDYDYDKNGNRTLVSTSHGETTCL